MGVYPRVLPQNLNRSLEVLRVLCISWWKRKFISGVFNCIEDKYGRFESTQDISTLGRGWTTGRRR